MTDLASDSMSLMGVGGFLVVGVKLKRKEGDGPEWEGNMIDK